MENPKKQGTVNFNNLNTNFREIIKRNNAVVTKVIFSFLGLYLLIGFIYDFVISYLHQNLNKKYMIDQGLQVCVENCFTSSWDIIKGLLTFQHIPFMTIIFISIALGSLFYVKFFSKSVLFQGIDYHTISLKDVDGLDDEEKMLSNIVNEMRIASVLNFLPEVHIYKDYLPNIFSYTDGDRNGFIAISSGALKTFNRDELTALVAHEMAHLKCQDNKVCYYVDSLCHTLDFLLEMVQEASLGVTRGGFIFSSSDRNNNGGGIYAMIIAFVIMCLSFILRLIVPFVTAILRRFLEEAIDLRADGLALKFTRNPLALHNVLDKADNFNYERGMRGTTRNHSSFYQSEERGWLASKLFPRKSLMRKRFEMTVKDMDLYNKEKEAQENQELENNKGSETTK